MFAPGMILLKDGRSVDMRLLHEHDAPALLQYLNALSAASKSRFGPHAFDEATVNDICNHLPGDDTARYVAWLGNDIKAYMLVKRGMIAFDAERYAQLHMHFDAATTVTYAPSVADDFQNTGLGSAMFTIIVDALKEQGCTSIILWGGVQATNSRAVHFYGKFGFTPVAHFWHDDKDNIDMVLTL
ncbi:GNAT family N-acetyltransferase [Panacibacter sp. DH6]|uniref:GNAT family N-acetyltransferase n=1 Tax=Panacibacter microcysteis TaxID=2793269 RepID=A0A931E4D9_9BACT|nr:GNAT family N-acetyltransferase [Panacibacter microcysteis]MBG9375065.1 GNAT family N-acetyltransferase [Panacibacter microcysteis]